jgi:uncharacterized membrane-anchored protein YhcB (DUF1043 family)
MTTAVWLTLLFVCCAASFYLGGLFTKRQYEHDELEKEVEHARTELEQYKQDVADHLASTNRLVDKMRDNYEQLVNHVADTRKHLLEEKGEVLPFFSPEATEVLTKSKHQDKTRSDILARNAELEIAPHDYVTGQTGIFAGESIKNEQTKRA